MMCDGCECHGWIGLTNENHDYCCKTETVDPTECDEKIILED